MPKNGRHKTNDFDFAKPSIAGRLAQGIGFHARGDLSRAAEIYCEILTQDARHVEALYRLGIAMVQSKRHELGVELIDKALAVKPDFAEAFNNRGIALKEMRRLEEALASYDKALAIKPGYAQAFNNRGNTLMALRRPGEALASYDRALAIKPDYVQALNNRGSALLELQQPGEALASFDKALAIKGDYAEAFNNRGAALKDLRRLDEALASYEKALEINPGYADAHNNRGTVLKELKRLDEAVASYDKALAISPDHAQAFNNRGNALLQLLRFEEALASYDRALAINPGYAEAFNNRGNALMELNRLDEALASYGKALAIKADYADALNNQSIALVESRRLGEAFESYGNALAIDNCYADAIFGRSLLFLLTGDFAAGWAGYESRWHKTEAAHRKLKADFPFWTGENIAGKKIIVYDEQGLGDIIQFSRYLPLLAKMGAQVTFYVRPILVGLLQSLGPEVRVISVLPDEEHFDYQCALLSLPLAFKTSLESIPANTPYLRADPDRVLRWKNRIGDHGFRIGIAWQGNKAALSDKGRSIALAEFFALSQIPDVRLISLQKNDGAEQLLGLPGNMKVESLGDDYDASGDAFVDAAAVMENLNLVISSDTSIAHLAGALGRPVWVALKYAPDWRWLLDRADSPWYPSMRLFRQPASGDWDSVFSDMESALPALIGERRRRPMADPPRTPEAPVSWGELIDKITILEIKSVEITGEAARANVMKELRLLQDIAAAQTVIPEIATLKNELKAINSALWAIEDSIRDKERKGEFDAEFIEIARSVYKRNDERAAVKRRINSLLASALVEEKSYEHY